MGVGKLGECTAPGCRRRGFRRNDPEISYSFYSTVAHLRMGTLAQVCNKPASFERIVFPEALATKPTAMAPQKSFTVTFMMN